MFWIPVSYDVLWVLGFGICFGMVCSGFGFCCLLCLCLLVLIGWVLIVCFDLWTAGGCLAYVVLLVDFVVC